MIIMINMTDIIYFYKSLYEKVYIKLKY